MLYPVWFLLYWLYLPHELLGQIKRRENVIYVALFPWYEYVLLEFRMGVGRVQGQFRAMIRQSSQLRLWFLEFCGWCHGRHGRVEEVWVKGIVASSECASQPKPPQSSPLLLLNDPSLLHSNCLKRRAVHSNLTYAQLARILSRRQQAAADPANSP